MNIIARRFTWHYAVTQLTLKYRYTSLGFFWNFLEPALFLAVLSLVFSVVNRMDIGDYAVFLFGALLPWRYFEKVVNTCMDSIVGGEWLLKKLYVSPFVLPLSRWAVASAELLFSLTVMFVFLAALKHPWTIHLSILPLALVNAGVGCRLDCCRPVHLLS
jgi:ABC-type polysaccharide/polyol phosphate export permease